MCIEQARTEIEVVREITLLDRKTLEMQGFISQGGGMSLVTTGSARSTCGLKSFLFSIKSCGVVYTGVVDSPTPLG